MLLPGCEHLQAAEMQAESIRQVRLAHHPSVSLTVQVNFVHRRELATLDQPDKYDQVVHKVLPGLERTEVLAINPEE